MNARRTSTTFAPIVAAAPASSTSSCDVLTGALTVAGPKASASTATSITAELSSTTRQANGISGRTGPGARSGALDES